MEEKITTRKKGVKAMIVDMRKGEKIVFPRKKYSNVVTCKSVAKIENPERDWDISVITDGIEVLCLK